MTRRLLPALAILLFTLSSCSTLLGSSPESVTAQPPPDGAPEEPAQIAQAYGLEHPQDFAGVYIDRDGGVRLVALFVRDLGTHQQALDVLLGPGQVVVEQATFTEAQLNAIHQDIIEGQSSLEEHGIQLVSVSTSTTRNLVEVTAKSDNVQAEALLRAFGPPGSVVVDLHPADKPWAQPASGDGWRLLGVFDTQLPYTVAVAEDGAQAAAELERHGIVLAEIGFDPGQEILIFLSPGIGSSCPELRLDDVIRDRGAQLVHGAFSDPLEPRACTADLVGARTFVLAVTRASLPPSPFTLRIYEQPIGCEPDCGSGASTMEVDLGDSA